MTKSLSKTELEIMQYLWNIDKEVTAGDIRTHFSDKNWSKQAVSTFLKKLVKHGYLNVRKESPSKYYYTVAITEDDYNISPAIEIIDKFFSGSLYNFICAFNGSDSISDEEAEHLYELIAQLKNNQN